jgi:hypothetical protein
MITVEGSPSCYLGGLKDTTPPKRSMAESPLHLPKSYQLEDPNVLSQIRSKMKLLNVDAHRAKRPPVFDIYHNMPPKYPMRECNRTVMEIWAKHGARANLSEKLIAQRERNRKSGWICLAQKALRQAAKAFALVDIPFSPSDGTSLGWWRGNCGCCNRSM